MSVIGIYHLFQWSSGCQTPTIAPASFDVNPHLLVSDDHHQPSNDYFSVQYPFIKDNWKLIRSDTVIKHTFNQLFGHYARGQWNAPKDSTSYNRAVLKFDVTVDGVQYDRLVNIFIGDVQVWRLLTIEPGGKQVHSIATKDITSYLLLLQHDQQITVQLDNVIDDKLTGAFVTALTVELYHVDDHFDRDVGQQFFATHKPAAKIYPLKVNAKDELPVRHLPHDPFKLNLPPVDGNTTLLKLEIFALGNADEEDWYSNVLNRYKDVVQNPPVLGHGPVRFIRVRVGDRLVAEVAPKPVIYTGAVSPALWRPVVSITAFDVPLTTVDLTPLLPLLWHHQANADRDLRIEVVNHEGKHVGNDWITTANLLAYQHSDITASKGKFGGVSQDNNEDHNGDEPNSGEYSQKVNVNKEFVVLGHLEFTVNDADVYKVKYTTSLQSNVDNFQKYEKDYRNRRVLHATEVVDHVRAVSEDDSKPLDYELTVALRDLLNLHYTYFTPKDDEDAHFKVALSNTRQLKVKARKMSHDILEVQTGALEYYVSPKGNHGRGSLDTNLSVTLKVNGNKHKYLRVVLVVDGKIRLDVGGSS